MHGNVAPQEPRDTSALLACLLPLLWLLLEVCSLPSKNGGSQSLPVHPGSSLPTAEWEREPSPRLGLGSGSWCGVGATSPGSKPPANAAGQGRG